MNPILNIEDRILSHFQSGRSLDSEYHRSCYKVPLEPERILMLALLEDAVVCYQKNLFARDIHAKRMFREVEDWILDDQSDLIFSFDSVCEFLGLTPGWLRRELMHWKERSEPSRRQAGSDNG